MIISVMNYVCDQISDVQLQTAIRAINRQISYDFEPYWSLGAQLRLEGPSGTTPKRQHPVDMRGDAVIYLWDDRSVKDALGYHDANHKGIPYGFVFPKISEEAGENWTVTLSHEALELIADADANLFVKGPHPTERERNVFFWYEICDAVQAESYKIDGIDVSNFLLPLYFARAEGVPGRNDFLNNAHSGKTLKPFGVNPGGYIGYFDPVTGKDKIYMMENDAAAAQRKQVKKKRQEAQRAHRYSLSIPPDGVPGH